MILIALHLLTMATIISNCSPIPFDPNTSFMSPFYPFGITSTATNMPMPAHHMSMPIFAPIMDYNTMRMAQQFPVAPAMMPSNEIGHQFDANRRSFPSFFRSLGNRQQSASKQTDNKSQNSDTDEQKALNDLPVSFVSIFNNFYNSMHKSF